MNNALECRICKANAVKITEFKLNLKTPFGGQSYLFTFMCAKCATSDLTLIRCGALSIENA